MRANRSRHIGDRVRFATAGAVGLLAMSLLGSACSDDEVSRGTAGPTSSTATSSIVTSSSVSDSGADFPCGLVPPDEIERISGNPLTGARTVDRIDDEGLTEYWVQECAWTAGMKEVPLTLSLGVSRSEDFDGRQLVCPPPADGSIPVPGLGTDAAWQWTDDGTSAKRGLLRVCSAQTLLRVRVSGAPAEAEQLTAGRELAERALSAL